jgi:hypothetical protein
MPNTLNIIEHSGKAVVDLTAADMDVKIAQCQKIIDNTTLQITQLTTKKTTAEADKADLEAIKTSLGM